MCGGGAEQPDGAPVLTAREREVLQRVASGSLDKEIARELGISLSGVHRHQERLHRKLRVQNRTEMVAVARKLGLLP